MAKKKASSKSESKVISYLVGGAVFYGVAFVLTKLLFFIADKIDNPRIIEMSNMDYTAPVDFSRYAADVNTAINHGLSIGALAILFLIVLLASFMVGEYYFVKKSKGIKDAAVKGLILGGIFIAIDAVWYQVYSFIMMIVSNGWSSSDLFAPLGSTVPSAIGYGIAIFLVALIEEPLIKKFRK